MPVTTAMNDAINYLVTLFTTDVTLGAATPPVLVLDGPQTNQQYATQILWVGVQNPDDDPGTASPAAVGAQEWAALGNRARYENFAIYCALQAWSGVGDITTARNTAFVMMAAVETLVRTNVNLGGNILFVNPGVTGHQLRQGDSSKGSFAPLQFTINCKARLVA